MEDLDDCRKETEIAEKKAILIKEDKYRDMTLRERCLMLNMNEPNNDKKKFQNVMSTSTSNEYLDFPRSKILKGQEQINETPTISFYSGKLMSSQNKFNSTSRTVGISFWIFFSKKPSCSWKFKTGEKD